MLLSYYRIYTRYRKSYRNKIVDTSDTRYCAKFQPFVTSNNANNCKKQFCIFCNFALFASLTLKMTSKFKCDLIYRHNLGVPDLFLQFFCTITLCASKSLKPKKHFESFEKCVDIRSTFSILFYVYLNHCKVEEFLRLILALLAKLLQLLNFLTLSNDQNPAKPLHRPFEKSLFLFVCWKLIAVF